MHEERVRQRRLLLCRDLCVCACGRPARERGWCCDVRMCGALLVPLFPVLQVVVVMAIACQRLRAGHLSEQGQPVQVVMLPR